jgi:hypothetical protein
VPGGSLTVIGTGIALATQLTPEASAALERADELHYLAADPVHGRWIAGLHADARPLHDLYRPGKHRAEIYDAIVQRLVGRVRAGREVCAAFYGHPGMFVRPSHEAVRRLREDGYRATMLPGISAQDCLFADLGVDPAAEGCQAYDATDFLVFGRRVDATAGLILWQIGFIGAAHFADPHDAAPISLLVDALLDEYGPEHEVVVYEASPYPIGEPYVDRRSLATLSGAEVPAMATLYVPPRRRPRANRAMAERLGMTTPAG